jgi:integrase
VIGRVDEVKTRHSKRAIPLDPALASLLLSYRREAPPSQWVFPSSRTGRPWVIQRTHLAPAGVKAGLGRIGWHTFRHTYSTMLRGLKVDDSSAITNQGNVIDGRLGLSVLSRRSLRNRKFS